VEDEREVGEAKALDLVRARLDLAEARERTVAASNAVITAAAGFKRSLGIEASRSGREEVFAADGDPLVWLYRGFPATAGTAAETMDAARTNAPALAIARCRLRAAGNQVDFAESDLLPSLSASLSLNWTDPLWYWQWGCSAVQTVFQGGRKVAALERAVLEMENAASAVDAAEHALALEIELAVSERNDASSARDTAAVSLRQAKDNLELVRSRYELGDVSRVDYTSAVAAYAAALGGRVSAFYRLQRAEAKLFSLVGVMPRYHEEKVKESK
jgi:outer membrane protein TolC